MVGGLTPESGLDGSPLLVDHLSSEHIPASKTAFGAQPGRRRCCQEGGGRERQEHDDVAGMGARCLGRFAVAHLRLGPLDTTLALIAQPLLYGLSALMGCTMRLSVNPSLPALQ